MGIYWFTCPQIHSRKGGLCGFGLLLLTVFIFQVKVGRLTNPLGTPITSPLVFGSHLLSLTEDGRNLLIWDATEESEYCYRVEIVLNAREVFHSQIQFEPGFTATHLLHPATYLNKVLVGGSDGSLQLWNIRTRYLP